VAALLIAGAIPALAAPGGIPGPPADHGHGTVAAPGHSDVAEAPEAEAPSKIEVSDGDGPPEWAKAYGWRIKNVYGMTYGHIRICATGNEHAQEQLECPDDPGFEFPTETHGASGFWLYFHSENGAVVMGG
ncbi:MAG: hypothetical protein GWP12_02205, partial [Nitrospirae bacterium]|nr:hypothetical protein [Nitrospirota bacterium]